MYNSNKPNPIPYELEADIRRDFTKTGDRIVSAIIAAARISRVPEFYIPPSLAGSYGLTSKQLNRGLDALEGRLIETARSKRGAYRRVRLLAPYTLDSDYVWHNAN